MLWPSPLGRNPPPAPLLVLDLVCWELLGRQVALDRLMEGLSWCPGCLRADCVRTDPAALGCAEPVGLSPLPGAKLAAGALGWAGQELRGAGARRVEP